MKTNNKAVFLLSMLLIVPTLRAVEPTHWDAMKGSYSGSITITSNSGKLVKGTGSVLFTPAAVTLGGVSYMRGDVKEVVIRRPRTECCGLLLAGVWPLWLVVESIGDPGFPKAIPVIIAFSPVIVGAAAVTGPPLLIIEGIRRLKPAKVLYDVVP